MSENIQNPHTNFEDYDQAEAYIDTVRHHYRERHGAFKGTRDNDTLQLIEEYARTEAALVIDRAFLGMMALGSVMGMETADNEATRAELADDETPRIGGFSWKDYRDEFANMVAGFAIITHRLERDSFGVPSFTELDMNDGLRVTEALFYDFQKHNAYRFGVEGSGAHLVPEVIEGYDEEWTRTRVVTGKYIDVEKARSEREISQNMAERGYRAKRSQHAAMKTSPTQYPELRQMYARIDKVDFDDVMSRYQNPFEALANREDANGPTNL